MIPDRPGTRAGRPPSSFPNSAPRGPAAAAGPAGPAPHIRAQKGSRNRSGRGRSSYACTCLPRPPPGYTNPVTPPHPIPKPNPPHPTLPHPPPRPPARPQSESGRGGRREAPAAHRAPGRRPRRGKGPGVRGTEAGAPARAGGRPPAARAGPAAPGRGDTRSRPITGSVTSEGRDHVRG